MGGAAATHAPRHIPEPPDISTLHQPHYHRRSADGQAHFPIGSLVEVHTDEDDLKDVFFSATVVRPSKILRKRGRKLSKKLCVEYHNLLAHEGGLERLREDVDVSIVRPAPPFLESPEGFQPGDVVDTFYKDGWWSGIVKRVLEGGRFVVTFQIPPDELEFGLEELRVHWDWVDGSWVRHEKKFVTGSMFNVGRSVEVSYVGEDCQSAWLPATILRLLEDGSLLVEYSHANTDKHAEAHKVTVDSIRPRPPLLKDKKFILLEKVDAFFNFGWWNGVITRALEDNRYAVFFKQINRVDEFSHSELRPHLDWKDGKWYISSQIFPELSPPSSDDRMHEHHVLQNCTSFTATIPLDDLDVRNEISAGKSFASLKPMKGQFEEIIPEPLHRSLETTTLARRRNHLSNSSNAISRPLKKRKEESAQGASQDAEDVSMKKKLRGSRKLFSVDNQSEIIDLNSDNPSWGKRIQRKKRIVHARQDVVKINSTSPSLNKSSARISHLHGKELVSVVKSRIDDHTKHAAEATPLPVVIGLPCAKSGSSGFEKTVSGRRRHSLSSEQIGDASGHMKLQLCGSNVKVSKRLGIEEKSAPKKRGRPRKIPLEQIQTPLTGSDDLGLKDDATHRIPALEPEESISSMMDQENRLDKDNLTTPISDLNVIKGSNVRGTKSIRLPGSCSLRRARGTGGESTVTETQDSLDASGGETRKADNAVEAANFVSEAPCTESDNEPLSKWMKEKNYPSTHNGPGLSPNISSQHVENSKKQTESAVLENSGEEPHSGMQVSDLVGEGAATENTEILIKVSDLVGEGTARENTGTLLKVSDLVGEGASKQGNTETPPGNESQVSNLVGEEASKKCNREKLHESRSQVSDLIGEGAPKKGNIGNSHESESQVSDLVGAVAVVPSGQQSLPFFKNTVLWKTIESMEVFQKIPQRPHFQPLENCRESSREGLAIGYMVTFSSAVDKAAKLKLDDPKSIMDDIFYTLADLETHGFNVRTVQDRISGLLALKCKQEKLIDEVNELNCEMLEHNHEISRIEAEILETDKQIEKLKVKRSVAVSAKEKGDEIIAVLAARLKETEAKIQDAGNYFEAIASSPW